MRLRIAAVMVTLIVMPFVVGLPVGQVSAQTLETAPGRAFIVSCAGPVASDNLPSCNWCSLVTMIANVVDYAIYLAVIVSALAFAYAGFLILVNNGNAGKVRSALTIFKRTLFGVIGVLAAWLIVDAIMTRLASGLGLGEDWHRIEGCQDYATPPQGGSQGGIYNSGGGYYITPDSGPYYPGNEYNPQGYDDIPSGGSTRTNVF